MKKITMMWLCLLLLCACVLSACGAPSMKQEGVSFRHPKTGICYYPASANYSAQKAADAEVYARIARDGVDALLFYPIQDVDPQKYIVTANGTLMYAEGLRLPTLSELSVKEVGLYDMQVNSSIAMIEKQDVITALKESYVQKPACAYQQLWLLQEYTSYDMRFYGKGEYAGIYYRLHYLLFEEDALVYVEMTDDFVDPYPEMDYEIEDYSGPDASGNMVTEVYAVYNFGKELIYDSVTGECRMAGVSLCEYVQ